MFKKGINQTQGYVVDYGKEERIKMLHKAKILTI